MWKCSHVYVSDPDRYSMQLVAECVKDAISRNILSNKDLYMTEKELLDKLKKDPVSSDFWNRICSNRRMTYEKNPFTRIVNAKRRYIDPLVKDRGRMSAISEKYRQSKEAFFALDFSKPLTAE